jgi:tetratricopeptide (TPR) repeat protein
VLTALQAADVDLDTGSEDRTRSILKCVEYSHSNLSQEAQRLLLCLAPFSGFIVRFGIAGYAEELRKLEPFQAYDFSLFDEAIQEAIHWGLLEPMDEEQELLTIQPVFPYFLKTKLNALDKATREALQAGFKNYYQGLADIYNQLMESKEPQERQLGIFFCRLEYENLYQALQICLANQESIDVFFCLYKYFELINDVQSKNVSAQSVCNSLENYSQEFKQGELGYQIGFALHRLATSYQDLTQYEQAKHYFEITLESYQVLSKTEERDKKIWSASTYHQLGMVAEHLREYEEARKNYQQALAIKVEFGGLGLPSSEAFRYEQAGTYHQLGNVEYFLREYEEARKNYQQALAIKVEFGDRYNQAGTYGQLGTVALELREYEEARKNYQQALAIFVEFGDRYNQAMTYHQLGRVAEELEEFPEAKTNFLQALSILAEFNDQYNLETFSIPALIRLYQTTQDPSILEALAQLFGITVDEVLEALGTG